MRTYPLTPISRRTYLKQIGFAAAATTIPSAFAAEAEPKPTTEELATLAGIAQKFLEQYNAPGLSVAIARHGQIVYAEGFGVADKATNDKVTPAHLFRIASVSKPITSVAIYTLIEQGKLRLDDLVFGTSGLLGADYGKVDQPFVEEITLHHLLTHTCGGWGNKANDPMFGHSSMNHHDLIVWTLKNQALENKPGTRYAYSNFGFCVLGRVLEKLTVKPYEKYVQSEILAKCGVQDMQIGGNTAAERAKNEVAYYAQNGGDPYRMNVRRMDSHGGWIATPSDLVKFATHVDGFKTVKNILERKTIETMVAPSTANPRYGSGWFVNEIPNWWHTGSLPGTATIMVRTARGLCWAAFTNTRSEGLNLDSMMWKMAAAVPAWKA